MPPRISGLPGNNLLTTLPRPEYERLASGLEPVKLTFGETLYQPGEPIRYAYFPIGCLVSLLALAEDRAAIEVGLVGREGMVGISVALGVGVSVTQALVQESGTAMRIKSLLLSREIERNPSLRKGLLRYADTLMAQAMQTAACSRFHLLDARLARLLLMTRDRMRSDSFHLTHEFLAQMLGVRRVGVTKAAGTLQKRKMIRYSRGNIRVLDVEGLETASCRCYQIVKNVGSRSHAGLARHYPSAATATA